MVSCGKIVFLFSLLVTVFYPKISVCAIKAAVDIIDSDGKTRLHKAACCGDVEDMALLLQEKANPNHEGKDIGFHTPLHYAALNGRIECMKLLIQHKADVHHRCGNSGSVVMHDAACCKNPSAMLLLKEQGASIDVQSVMFGTPLHMADYHSNVECVAALIEWQADINACDTHGKTPFFYACTRNRLTIAHLLRLHGAHDPCIEWNTVSREVRDAIESIDASKACVISNLILQETPDSLVCLPVAVIEIVDDYVLTPALLLAKINRNTAHT